MQFVVPQFIEVESKVIGPISVRQFIILLITAGIVYVEFELFTFWLFAILGVFTVAIGGVLAFAKVNGQPFHTFMLSAIQTMRRPALAAWHRDISNIVTVTKRAKGDRRKKKKAAPFVPKANVEDSDIAELSLIVDTAGQYSAGDLERIRAAQQLQQSTLPENQPPTKNANQK